VEPAAMLDVADFAGVHDDHVYDGGAGCAEPDAAWSPDEASIPPCIVIEARKAYDRVT
jgi:hypothetical protein